MKAIILSAGRGKRLLPMTEDKPKCLMPINGHTLLEEQLDSLIACGVTDIAVVVGFGAELVEDIIDRRRTKGVQIQPVLNPFFKVSDNLASCWMARAHMAEDFLLLNGDTLFKPEILKHLLDSPEAPVTVTIDQKAEYDDDDMKVQLEDDWVMTVSKQLPPDMVNGESIGLLYLRGSGPKLFTATLDEAVRGQRGISGWFLKAIDQMAKMGAVKSCSIKGMTWAEVDTPEDLENAQALFG